MRLRWIVFALLFIFYVGSVPAAAEDPVGATVATHYTFSRPLPASAKQIPEYLYPYGWNRGGTLLTHHGADIVNPRGTPVLAVGEGTVYYAGGDAERIFGTKGNFYGNVIVIEHDFDAPEGGKVYTLYGHLNTIDVEGGTRVAAGQQIGTVGAKGVALGSHLHLEVRVGNPDDYNAVRNPMLWLQPLQGSGTLIARMVNADGTLATGIRVTITTEDSVRPTFTYIEGFSQVDPAYNENLVLSDLPAGCYRLRVRGRYDAVFCIQAGEATFVEAVLN
ncbi:MAG TPA: M23 family metallopeptidase [Aggregatilineales bacterium]|nr:M23 family metallopeptidase [Anaerolineales bacterium]HRE47266.1 M23 family metallopeptidase [Aggregatilineales bacterium]